jgi:hypothetical protein
MVKVGTIAEKDIKRGRKKEEAKGRERERNKLRGGREIEEVKGSKREKERESIPHFLCHQSLLK